MADTHGITWDLPVISLRFAMWEKIIKYNWKMLRKKAGFFILQHAKQMMLNFYYGVVDRRISWELYQYCEMDTDFAYFCIHRDTLNLSKHERILFI